MGAGVIPFAVHQKQVHFLFQTVFRGRKMGHYIDFGGGINIGETHQQAAAREFVEETETLFLSKDREELKIAQKTPERVAQQLPLMTQLFQQTLQQYPHWWCQREPGNKIPPKDWKSFFIEVEYQDLNSINQVWEEDEGLWLRFSKRRELHWIDADSLLSIYQYHPDKLWKRVRQLINAQALIQEIKEEKLKA